MAAQFANEAIRLPAALAQFLSTNSVSTLPDDATRAWDYGVLRIYPDSDKVFVKYGFANRSNSAGTTAIEPN